ncbi:DEAD/DEAH box helicase [Aquincola tertiaricarbonis]|uniref:DEAD/DEAH box helicase n=1 Tax=Aquincola tertiaricarbonis TaxID=391953 RepID=A0ABY4SB18_AQUTE|nr:DEAD/DEAH box helicase [Aquincola tertiaricarbonis]URI09266.1 DEAD/DEAH box helicase [Aquincola tertiaricarbonis]
MTETTAVPEAPARFDTLPLDPKLLRAVADQGYATMTPIQAKAIPVVLAGRDVMGAAQTGTGKTAAFSIPLLQKMLRHENASMSPARHPVRALVLAPTRELADQVAANVKSYAQHTNLRSAVVFGGIDMKPQTLQLKAGVEILIATPGRLLDHIEAKNCVLNQVEYVVLDEADRMLDIGFLPDLQRILSFLPKQRQTLLFSATFSPEIKKLSQSYLQDPVLVEVARPNATATNVEQRFYSVADDDKRRVVRQILRDRQLSQAIVFVNSKLGAARLARSFERDDLKTAALHGDKSQDERLKSLEAFKRGEVDVLVATDVAARGLDIADLPAVFNFDVPFNAEDYVHRIGRTGRAGASGIAVTLVTRDDARLIGDIEKLIKKKIDLEPFELEDDRPRRFRPRELDDAAPRERAPAERSYERAAAPTRRYGSSAPAADPFFDKPYEPSTSDSPPAWEKGAAAAVPAVRGLTPNIRTKRKVAALLGGGQKA